ncbi:MAG: hypothetical protein L3J04_06920 [Robiginitomaculum sp.]|nr:hypothetical protein [Robiginitomaculum sp.]
MGKFALVFLLVLLGGCYPRFEEPLTAVTASSYDKCLAGAWRLDSIGDEQEDDLIFHFGRGEGGAFEIVTISYSRNDEIRIETMDGHSSSTSVGSFLNIKEVIDDKELYTYLWYELSNLQLVMRPIDPDVISAALDTGKLQADAQSDYITSDPSEIIAYFAQAGEDLFAEDKMLFSRITKSRC